MGNSTSNDASEEDTNRFDGVDTVGFRVLGVQPNSPASKAGLVSFFDFLVGANGVMLFGAEDEGGNDDTEEGQGHEEYYKDVDFPEFLKQNVDTEIELLVWNIKSQTQRVLSLTPSNSWGGTGLLGVTIRMDDYAASEERLLRVLNVVPHSPAAIAGLIPMTDYLLGTTMESFDTEDSLANVLQNCVDRLVEVYVYNTETDLVRVVSIMPTFSWEGPGLLGCEVGRGYLHRLPSSCRETNGISYERSIRMGARDTTSSAEMSQASTDHAPMVTAVSSDNQTLTCAISGAPVHLEPQIEIESDPDALSYNSNRKFVTLEEITMKVPKVADASFVSRDQSQHHSIATSIGELPPPPIIAEYIGDHASPDLPVSTSSIPFTLPPPPIYLENDEAI